MSGDDAATAQLEHSVSSGKLQSLTRLFESTFFDMDMAIIYLQRYPDDEVQEYICRKLPTFSAGALEFYLPQLLALYLSRPLTSVALAEFIVEQCSISITFCVLAIWHLEAAIQSEGTLDARRRLALQLLLNIERAPPKLIEDLKRHRRTVSDHGTPRRSSSPPVPLIASSIKRSTSAGMYLQAPHQDPDEDKGSPTLTSTPPRSPLKSPNKMHASTSNLCESPFVFPDRELSDMGRCVEAERSFIRALMDIGTRLRHFSKDARRTQLYAELALLNLTLPSRVYLPICEKADPNDAQVSRHFQHHIVRIPAQEAVILNSKDKVPYLIQVEVLECSDFLTGSLPEKKQFDVHQPEEVKQACSADFEPVVQDVFRPGDIRNRLSTSSLSPGFKYSQSMDESAKSFKEPWSAKRERIRRQSPFGSLPNWHLVPVIVKCGDDLRQEQLAAQLLFAFQRCWRQEGLTLWLKSLQLVVTSSDSGLVEVIDSAVSLHQARKHSGFSLLQYYEQEFGHITSAGFKRALRNFVESLAAYSLFCYFVQVKDRHNGNILLDAHGHILHIDFGFILSNSPRNLGFENAPFKLTEEFLELMGDVDGDVFQYFRTLLIRGFIAARKHRERFVVIVDITQQESSMPCFIGGPETVKAFEERFQLGLTEDQLVAHVDAVSTCVSKL